MKPLLVQLRLKMKIYFKKNNNVPSGEGGEDETLTINIYTIPRRVRVSSSPPSPKNNNK